MYQLCTSYLENEIITIDICAYPLCLNSLFIIYSLYIIYGEQCSDNIYYILLLLLLENYLLHHVCYERTLYNILTPVSRLLDVISECFG